MNSWLWVALAACVIAFVAAVIYLAIVRPGVSPVTSLSPSPSSSSSSTGLTGDVLASDQTALELLVGRADRERQLGAPAPPPPPPPPPTMTNPPLPAPAAAPVPAAAPAVGAGNAGQPWFSDGGSAAPPLLSEALAAGQAAILPRAGRDTDAGTTAGHTAPPFMPEPPASQSLPSTQAAAPARTHAGAPAGGSAPSLTAAGVAQPRPAAGWADTKHSAPGGPAAQNASYGSNSAGDSAPSGEEDAAGSQDGSGSGSGGGSGSGSAVSGAWSDSSQELRDCQAAALDGLQACQDAANGNPAALDACWRQIHIQLTACVPTDAAAAEIEAMDPGTPKGPPSKAALVFSERVPIADRLDLAIEHYLACMNSDAKANDRQSCVEQLLLDIQDAVPQLWTVQHQAGFEQAMGVLTERLQESTNIHQDFVCLRAFYVTIVDTLRIAVAPTETKITRVYATNKAIATSCYHQTTVSFRQCQDSARAIPDHAARASARDRCAGQYRAALTSCLGLGYAPR
jgi:hypothetical protein